jgi:hypothetical protein
MGTVSGMGTYKKGDLVTLTATPAAKHIFVRWYNVDEDINVSSNPYTFTASRDITIQAVFRRAPKRIVVKAQSSNPIAQISDEEEIVAVVEVGHETAYINNMSEGVYRIFDNAGRMLFISSEDKIYSLPSGIYLIQMDDQTEKFIIQ